MSSLQKDVLGGVGLAELAGPLRDFLEKLGGPRGNRWLIEFKRFLRRENPFSPVILRIDRTEPFNPVRFLGEGWRVVEQDERSLALDKVDISEVCLEHCLEAGELTIEGEERLNRLKTMGYIRLDAKVFQSFWENQYLIPENWKRLDWISFDGTILLGPDDKLHVLFLYWRGDVWGWLRRQLDNSWNRIQLSAILSST